ncbi:hypothetical protein D3C76_866680 [compost metagenome]
MRDDFTIAGLFHGRQFEVQQYVVRDEGNADARRVVGGTQVDERRTATGVGAATDPGNIPVAFVLYRATPAHAEAFVIINVGFHDARLDHHLTHRDIQLRNDSPQFVEPVLGLVGNDVVGALIDGDRSPFVGFRLGTGHRLEQFGDIGRLGVIDLQQFPTQRRQVGNLLL